ncbi:uncharacterized protein [Rutidosis leptorrhynchoides]|uniref:uncharacterized protein n=1 Tax=Rutidosis leptorrhynchoides TaxID=125765 RepID=UPI003A99EF55
MLFHYTLLTLKESNQAFKKANIPFRNLFVKVIGDGASTSFWNDTWLGEDSFKNRFKRLSRLENDMGATVKNRTIWDWTKCMGNWSWVRPPSGRANGELQRLNELLANATINPQIQDHWSWKGSTNGIFTTKSLTDIINSKLLVRGNTSWETMRNALVPKKIEVFMWRVRRKRLPVMTELDKGGIDLHSVRCPLCDNDIESVDHSLILCKHAYDVWNKVFDWWGRGGFNFANVEDFFRDTGPSNSLVSKKIWQAVIWSCCYLIWKNRNQKVFSNRCWNVPVALNDIQVKSFEWIAKRCKDKTIDWHSWIHNPISLC